MASMFIASYPSFCRSFPTCLSRIMLSMSLYSGLVFGKWRPMSPRAAAPSRASLTAWSRTSASLWPSSPFDEGMSTPPIISLRPSRKG